MVTEVFLGVLPHLQIGVYDATTNLCPAGMRAGQGTDFCHQLGVFARMQARVAESKGGGGKKEARADE
jgi:hypothetical protein